MIDETKNYRLTLTNGTILTTTKILDQDQIQLKFLDKNGITRIVSKISIVEMHEVLK